jgi:hypothetical protein
MRRKMAHHLREDQTASIHHSLSKIQKMNSTAFSEAQEFQIENAYTSR